MPFDWLLKICNAAVAISAKITMCASVGNSSKNSLGKADDLCS